jgi:hypothetical protein
VSIARPAPVDRSDSESGGFRQAVHRRTGDSPAKLLTIAALLAATAVVMTVVAVARIQGLSAIDEYTHLDWVYQVLHGGIPADGDVVADKILSDWSCLGQWNVKDLPPCGQPEVADNYPNGGEQYNAFHPPLYYAITAGLVRFGSLFVGDQYFTALSRSTGALWLAAGMTMLYVACRAWRLRTVYAVAAPLLLLTLPRILTAATMVSNDAPAALAGGYALYYLARLRIGRAVNLIVPSLVTLLLSATKVLNALPMLLVAGGFGCWAVVAALRRQPLTAWRRFRAAVVIVAPTAAFYLLWGRIQGARAQADWVNPVIGQNTRDLVADPLTAWAATLPSGFDLIRDVNLVPELRSTYFTGWNTGISVLLAASGFFVLLVFGRPSRRRWPAVLLLAGCALFPLIVQLQALGMGAIPQFFPDISRRYGMTLLPIAAFCLAVVADARNLRRTTVAVVGVGLIVVGGSAFGYLVR